MKIGLIITCDNSHLGGEKGIGKYFLDHFKRVGPDDEYVVLYAISGELPKSETELLHYDGFIISGSHCSANDKHAWISRLTDFIRMAYTTCLHYSRPRIFGICFGHQLMAKALGGKVSHNPGHAINFGSAEILITDEYREQSYMRHLFKDDSNKRSIRMMKYHSECVQVLPKVASRVGTSKECLNEILAYDDCMMSCQGHPDYVKSLMLGTNLQIYLDQHGSLDIDRFERSIDCIEDNDVWAMTKTIRKFIQQ